MQSLDVISVNIWHILISLCNLVILFLIAKMLLFKPVKRMFAERQAELDARYAEADEAKREAFASREALEKELAQANERADEVIKNAADIADHRADEILADANQKAADILRRAENEALLTKRKAEEGIKREIAEVSAAIAEKMIEREVKPEDHRELIDSFISEIGDDQ